MPLNQTTATPLPLMATGARQTDNSSYSGREAASATAGACGVGVLKRTAGHHFVAESPISVPLR